VPALVGRDLIRGDWGSGEVGLMGPTFSLNARYSGSLKAAFSRATTNSQSDMVSVVVLGRKVYGNDFWRRDFTLLFTASFFLLSALPTSLRFLPRVATNTTTLRTLTRVSPRQIASSAYVS